MPPPFSTVVHVAPIIVGSLPVSYLLRYTVLLYFRMLDLLYFRHNAMQVTGTVISTLMAAPRIQSGVVYILMSSSADVYLSSKEVLKSG